MSPVETYRCEICWKTFVVPSLLTDHKKREHGTEEAA